jgi:hypothetical protein
MSKGKKVESKKVVASEFPEGVTEKQLLALSHEMNEVMDLDPRLDTDEVDLEQIKTEAGEIRPEDFEADRTDDDGNDIPHFSDKAKATLKAIGIAIPGDEPEPVKAKAKASAKANDDEDEDEDEEESKPKAKAKTSAKAKDEESDEDESKPKAKAKASSKSDRGPRFVREDAYAKVITKKWKGIEEVSSEADTLYASKTGKERNAKQSMHCLLGNLRCLVSFKVVEVSDDKVRMV